MAPTKPDVKSRLPARKRAPPASHFKDEDILLLWTAFKMTNMEVTNPALAQELGVNIPAARMRWTRLKAKLVAFEEKEKEAKAEASPAASPAAFPAVASPAFPTDATMEDVGAAEDNEATNDAVKDESAE
ncbi:uncharacterized protein PGRI_071780 [Penicillium griseofulvum]|uniref:Myb-like DNA-binding domain-containing protein n=1 Tax=Penicillium patulum TaxID=5078 RepID=A0A135LYJ0_PENPA|nr:uncharacterized protein PGRI_071780 [Penicillium griseofulvum]KXG54034.1 hypothetical protein PGRI_071780 [Penicillium griseofulvum]